MRSKVLGLALLVALVGVGCYFAFPPLQLGAGYGAKLVCSSVFTAGRNFESAVEAEINLPLPIFSVSLHPSSVVCSTLFGLITRTATYDPVSESCTLAAPGDQPVIRTRPAQPAYTWRDDVAWPVGEMNALNLQDPSIDYNALEKVVREAFEEPDAKKQRNTRAVIVVHRGQIVLEKYAEGFTPQTRQLGWSMTKSVLSTLIGFRIQEGRMNLNDTHLNPLWGRSPRDERAAITLDQLLRASSGLEFREVNDLLSDTSMMLFGTGDHAAFAANKPPLHAPDTHWSYSSGTTNILSQCLRDSFDSDEEYWAYPAKVFSQMGMTSMLLDTDAAGTFVGSSYSYATPRDWVRFGLFALHRGKWDGQQVLDSSWFEYALTPSVAAPHGEYGAQWWLNAGPAQRPSTRYFPSLPRDAFFALGYQGQSVSVFPSQDLVVVRLGCSTSGAWDPEPFLAEVLNCLSASQ